MVANCDFDYGDGCGKCRRCGFTLCGAKPPIRRRCDVQLKPGLGDMAASALAAVYITKERVEATVGGPCGCDERQEAMNEFGRKWLGIGNPSPTEAKDGQEGSGVDR
jgi:hypothetical protein